MGAGPQIESEEEGVDRPVVLITGIGIGIGAATAQAFTRAGYRAVVTDVLDGEPVVSAIARAVGEAEYHHLDVCDTREVDAVVEERYGPIDCVVANAAIARRAPLEELSDECWDATHDVDLKGVMRVCRAAAPAMRRAGPGSMFAV